jgi:hypothetical protein
MVHWWVVLVVRGVHFTNISGQISPVFYLEKWGVILKKFLQP